MIKFENTQVVGWEAAIRGINHNGGQAMKCLADSKTAAKLIDERVNALTQERVNALTLAVAVTLLDKCRLSQSTVVKAINGIIDLCDGINKGYVSFVDLEKILLDEYKIKLSFKK